jgi:hypothetical protein
LLDPDVLALLKATHSLLGLAYGKLEANRTVLRQLRKRQDSVDAASAALEPVSPPATPLQCEIKVEKENEVEEFGGAVLGSAVAEGRKQSFERDADDRLSCEPPPPPTPERAEDAPLEPPSDLEALLAMLRAFEADLHTWHAHSCLDPDPLQAAQLQLHDPEMQREIRSRATKTTLFAIAIVVRTTWAVDPSQLCYVHAASFRPWKASQTKHSVADSMLPGISKAFFRSRALQIILPLLWVIGVTCYFLVLFDRFGLGSVLERIACFAVTLTFPSVISITASFNAKTVRRLLKEFETLYVLAYVLGMVCMQLVLFREHPVKVGCIVLMLPSLLMSGFMDAYIEGGRVLTSRVFFCLNLAGLLIFLALVTLKLGVYTDDAFRVLSLPLVASSCTCSLIMTLCMFGGKNVIVSLRNPGSLATLVSDLCCILLDADAFALLKAAYSLLGVKYGQRKVNRTMEKQLLKHRKSIIASKSGLKSGRVVFSSNTVAAAPADNISTNLKPQAPSAHSRH